MTIKTGRYEDIRPYINSGDIVFVGGKGFIGRLIMFCTFSKYSHVGIAVNVSTGAGDRLMFAESEIGTKLNLVNLSRYLGYPMSIVPAITPWSLKISQKVFGRINVTGYSIPQAIHSALRDIFLRFFGWNFPKAKDYDGEICSEFIAKVYNLPDSDLSPEALLRYLRKSHHTIKYEIIKE